MLQIAIAGASGRMGRMLAAAVLADPTARLCGALDIAGSPALGQDPAQALGLRSEVLITQDLRAALGDADVLIDFTRPEGTLVHLAVCAELGVNAVIGTTGFTPRQKAQVAAFATRIAVVKIGRAHV